MTQTLEYILDNLDRSCEVYFALNEFDRQILEHFDTCIKEELESWLGQGWAIAGQHSLAS